MEKLERELRLYKITEKMVALEQPLKVAELGLSAFLEVLGAKGGVCIIRTDFSQPMELATSINLTVDENDRQNWHDFTSSERVSSISGLSYIPEKTFKDFFGDLVKGDYDKALAVPLMNNGDFFGIAFVLGTKGDNALAGYDEAEVTFVASRIATCYKAALRYQEALGLAYIDSLTDLYNARYLPIILGKRLEEARKVCQPLSLLFLDMDNFREVNNEHGHQAGGKALIEVGWILERHVRAKDTVIRYGGDEYTVILPTASLESAREIAERIRLAIKEHIFLRREGYEVKLTASIGVATFPDDADTPEALLHLADQAMYRGKETTRDAVYLYSAVNREN